MSDDRGTRLNMDKTKLELSMVDLQNMVEMAISRQIRPFTSPDGTEYYRFDLPVSLMRRTNAKGISARQKLIDARERRRIILTGK